MAVITDRPENAPKIRYIKLGQRARWWRECLINGTLRLGFDSGSDVIYEAAIAADWQSIKRYWMDKTGTPTQHTNQTREFFEDEGSTLWITFEDGSLFYAFTDGGKVHRIPSDGHETSSYRKLNEDGWRNVDASGKTLRIDQLSGKLTKTAAYRQTICGLRPEAEAYLRLRLAGKTSPVIEKAERAKQLLLIEVEEMVQSFTWQDFEVLVELIFAQSGLRRLSRTGGPRKTTDIDLENPITGELAFVQIKSQTTQSELQDYINRKLTEKSEYANMYYVYHTGIVDTDSSDVVVWDVKEVAKQALANGLLDWVIDKTK